MRVRLALAAVACLPRLAGADGLTVLTVGKVAAFKNGRGMVRVGRDPRLANAPSPACPTKTAVELSSYPEPTQRVVASTTVDLDCGKWKPRRGGFVYSDPAARGGVRAIRSTRDQRVALFADADPANDPTVIGAGAEACVACHTR
jgi:hypothetical protein